MRIKFFSVVLLFSLLFTSSATVHALAARRGNDPESLARNLLAQKLGTPASSLNLAAGSAIVRYPTLGIAVREYKYTDPNGSTFLVALDTQGNEVRVEELDEAERAAYESKFGKLDREALRVLAGKSRDDLFEVNIWLVMPETNRAFARPEMHPSAGAGFDELTRAQRQARKQQAASEEPPASFDAAAWSAYEEANARDEMARVETVTRPFVEEMRIRGFAASGDRLAPLVNVRLPARLIRIYARRADVEMIYLAGQPANEMDVARRAIGAQTVNASGINGAGARIAVVEFNGMAVTGNPYLGAITRDNLYGCPANNHATGIAGILRSAHATYPGIARDASIRIGCGITNAQLQTITERGLEWGAETFSLSWYSGNHHAPGALDRFYDRIMFAYHDLVVKSAGNRGASDYWVTPPGLGYNTLSVGNFDDRNTVLVTDDIMYPTSSWKGPLSAHGDREKPEVAAPGANIFSATTSSPWIGNIGTGTSYSAPMVAGMSALLYQRNPALTAWPESTKAILMATAVKNKEGATRLSEVDGAGGVWAPDADLTARNHTVFGGWGGMNYACDTPTDLNIATVYLYYGYKARIVIVWDQNTSYDLYANKPSADLDLQIYAPNNSLAGSSSSWDNTYEIVEFTPSTSGYYRIQVDKARCNLTPRYLGWAWSQP